MKFSSKLLVIAAFQPAAWMANGFVVTSPAFKSSALHSTIYRDPNPSFPQNAYQQSQEYQQSTPTYQQSTPNFQQASVVVNDNNQSWKVGNSQQKGKAMLSKEEIWAKANSIVVQGGSLRTCSFDESVERVQVILKSEGRPLNSSVELWQGPDNTPQKIKIFLEDGGMRQFRTVLETPRSSNAVCVKNTAQMEFPLNALVDSDVEDEYGNFNANPREFMNGIKGKIVQGGAVNTTPFAPAVSAVQILLKTDGRPMNVRIELLQGPNNNKQVMEVYIEDGAERPFYAIVDTPGSGNVVRIVNTSTLEYPLNAVVEAYEMNYNDNGYSDMTWSE